MGSERIMTHTESDSPVFDPVTAELEGTTLVEASAGTGKTFSLGVLYLRAVMEKEADVDGILAVTFTNAAVAELKDRVRRFAEQALYCTVSEAADGSAASDEADEADPLIFQSVKRAVTVKGEKRVRLMLKKMLSSMDEAHIYTIHGFCQRVLDEHGFLSKSRFETAIIPDDSEYIREAAEDFYKREIERHSSGVAFFLKEGCGLSPDKIARLAGSVLNKQGLEIVSDEVDVFLLDRTWERIKTVWQRDSRGISDFLKTAEQLKRRKDVYRQDSLADLLAEFEYAVASDIVDKGLITKLALSTVKKETKKNKSVGETYPFQEFFRACEDFLTAGEAVRGYLFKKGAVYIRERIREKKRGQNQRTFNDLLFDVHKAVCENGGHNKLVRLLRKKYRIGFIDEFQDTDKCQWEIFHAVFVAGGRPLFLIGDPKQAIYSFRGADVFSYIHAKRHTPGMKKRWLNTNYRSSDRLVKAVNTVFLRRDKPGGPFLIEEIGYKPVVSSKKAAANTNPMTSRDREAYMPFVIWKEENVTARSNYAGEIETAVANELYDLLTVSPLRITEAGCSRKIRPRDAAVLVVTHAQARAVKKVLDDINIPSVIGKSGSVFSTAAAYDMLTLLGACQMPLNTALVRGTLVTGLIGTDETQVYNLNEADFERHLDRFRTYSRIWADQGIARMISACFSDYAVYDRLLKQVSGERSLTNLRHAADLLHLREKETGAAPAELFSWLSDRISSAGDEAHQEFEMNLESDESAVKIVTVHASKGLEYPVVFAPYFFAAPRAPERLDFSEAIYHDTDNRLVLDLRSGQFDKAAEAFRREDCAEKLRLFYVAVTRASYLFYTMLPTGFKNREMAPVFHFLEAFAAGEMPENAPVAIRELPSQKRPGLFYGADRHSVPLRTGPVFKGTIEPGGSVSSYSGIVRHQIHDGFDTPGDDYTIIGFKRGADAGNALHDIFELLDFEAPDTYEETVETVLARYNLRGDGNEWTGTVKACVENVMKSALACGDSVFSLGRIPPDKRTAEFEFYLNLNRVRQAEMVDILGSDIGNIRFDELSGWLHGYIDLVFQAEGRYFVLDWKSNYLGPGESDYTPDNLAGVMNDYNYHLQYYIYTLAFNRFLEKRVRNYTYRDHFGGVYYLFLRGFSRPRDMERGDDTGIFFHRPDPGVIARLSRIVQADRNREK